MKVTQVKQFVFGKLKIPFASSRFPTARDVIPFVDDMVALIILGEAYLNDDEIHSIQELRDRTGIEDLKEIAKTTRLIEGSKALPDSLAKTLADLCEGDNIFVVQQDHGADDPTFWKIEGTAYLGSDLIDGFEEPFGSFWIVPSNESWLLHTADDGPWIYAVLPSQVALQFAANHPEITQRIEDDFDYLR